MVLVSKLAEKLTEEYFKKYGLKYTVIRYVLCMVKELAII